MRALDVLASVDYIACEDTRHSGALLSYYGIKKPLLRYNDHSNSTDRTVLLERITSGESVALISDAGSPLIADPGYKLVQDCLAMAVKVEVIPGATALVMAAQLAGLPTDKFCFLGFLPARHQARCAAIAAVKTLPVSLIWYEAPHRLTETVQDLITILGDRQAAVCRELTKLFEESRRGLLSVLLTHYQQNPPRGEIVLVVAGNTENHNMDAQELLHTLLAEMPMAKAVAEAVRLTGLPRKQLYQQALDAKK